MVLVDGFAIVVQFSVHVCLGWKQKGRPLRRKQANEL